jgi:hypothetical protein
MLLVVVCFTCVLCSRFCVYLLLFHHYLCVYLLLFHHYLCVYLLLFHHYFCVYLLLFHHYFSVGRPTLLSLRANISLDILMMIRPVFISFLYVFLKRSAQQTKRTKITLQLVCLMHACVWSELVYNTHNGLRFGDLTRMAHLTTVLRSLQRWERREIYGHIVCVHFRFRRRNSKVCASLTFTELHWTPDDIWTVRSVCRNRDIWNSWNLPSFVADDGRPVVNMFSFLFLIVLQIHRFARP